MTMSCMRANHTCREQRADPSGSPIQQVPRVRPIRTIRADRPERVVVRLADDLDARAEVAFQSRKVVGDGDVDGEPGLLGIFGTSGAHIAGLLRDDPIEDVGLRMFSDKVLRARLPVDAKQRCLVAADRAAQKPGVAFAGKMQGSGDERIIRADRHDFVEVLSVPTQQAEPAIPTERCCGQSQVQFAVDDECRNVIAIFIHEPPLAADDVDHVEIAPIRIAIVERDGDQHPSGERIGVVACGFPKNPHAERVECLVECSFLGASAG